MQVLFSPCLPDKLSRYSPRESGHAEIQDVSSSQRPGLCSTTCAFYYERNCAEQGSSLDILHPVCQLNPSAQGDESPCRESMYIFTCGQNTAENSYRCTKHSMKSLRFAGVVDDAAEEDPAVERRQLVGQRARRPRRLPQGEVPRLRMRTHHIALRRAGMDDQWNFPQA